MRNMKWELECTVTCAMWSIWGVCVIYIEICVCVCNMSDNLMYKSEA